MPDTIITDSNDALTSLPLSLVVASFLGFPTEIHALLLPLLPTLLLQPSTDQINRKRMRSLATFESFNFHNHTHIIKEVTLSTKLETFLLDLSEEATETFGFFIRTAAI